MLNPCGTVFMRSLTTGPISNHDAVEIDVEFLNRRSRKQIMNELSRLPIRHDHRFRVEVFGIAQGTTHHGLIYRLEVSRPPHFVVGDPDPHEEAEMIG